MRRSFIASEPLRRGTDRLARLARFAASPGWLAGRTPSADIYFLNAMGDLVGGGSGVTAIGPNVYGVDGRFVILRYATGAELDHLEAARPRRVFYVIDDDLEALSRSRNVPAGYRARLSGFVARSLPRILALTDTVLAPSPQLLARFPDHHRQAIAPSYCSVCDDMGHFDLVSPLRLVFTGTRSHLGDLAAIAPALERLCASSHVELTSFLGASTPRRLRRLANVVCRSAMDWPAYRRFMAGTRYHVALAPFRPSATNLCRSHNKLHDHAAFGAAGLYGDIPAYRTSISHGEDGLVLAGDPDAWFDALARLVDDPGAARRLAEAGGALSRRIGNPETLRAFWCRRLGLDPA